MVSPYSLSAPGGVQGQVLGLARAMVRAGHETAVLGPADGPVPGGDEGGFDLVTLGGTVGLPANGSVARLALSPLAARRATGWIRARRPDVVHLHEPLAPGATLALLSRSEPKVGTFHRAGAVTGARVLSPVSQVLAGRLAARTAVSEEARRTAAELCGGEYELIGNGIEVDRFTSVAPWPTTGPTILFVGRHEERKGLAILLDAFDTLAGEPAATLWVAGEGPDSKELRAPRRRSAAQWLGRLDDDELAGAMSGADVLCAPSLFGESFGVVLLEAMVSHCVVVASDLPGYAAVVGEHGVLVPAGNVEALALALGAVLSDVTSGQGRASPSALDAAARHGAGWSMDAMAARYVEVYRRVLEGSASGRP